jgi:hypothetical protein
MLKYNINLIGSWTGDLVPLPLLYRVLDTYYLFYYDSRIDRSVPYIPIMMYVYLS